jgi:hypothetical protein
VYWGQTSAPSFTPPLYKQGRSVVLRLEAASRLADLYGLRTRWETDEGIAGSARRLTVGSWTMAVVAWLTVITGTWIVYPWYREKLAGADAARPPVRGGGDEPISANDRTAPRTWPGTVRAAMGRRSISPAQRAYLAAERPRAQLAIR